MSFVQLRSFPSGFENMSAADVYYNTKIYYSFILAFFFNGQLCHNIYFANNPHFLQKVHSLLKT